MLSDANVGIEIKINSFALNQNKIEEFLQQKIILLLIINQH